VDQKAKENDPKGVWGQQHDRPTGWGGGDTTK